MNKPKMWNARCFSTSELELQASWALEISVVGSHELEAPGLMNGMNGMNGHGQALR